MEIKTVELTKTYGENRVLERLSLTFPEGSASYLMGPSGCGKTTLLFLLMGLIPPTEGRVLVPPRTRFSAVFQENRLLEHRSAVDNLLLACGRTITAEKARQSLTQVGLPRDSHSIPVSELSGGMARRVAVVRAMLAPSDVVILDEALKGLDSQSYQKTVEFIQSTLGGRTLIGVTHDPAEPPLFSASVVWLG